MIHRESRDRLALALRRYVSGRIDNFELGDIEVDPKDRGAQAVQSMAWFLYDDLRQHHVGNDMPRGSETRRELARWVVFLHSGQEYSWPSMPWPSWRFLDLLLNLLTVGRYGAWKRQRSEKFFSHGDFAAWPFRYQEDLNQAARFPRLLRGAFPRSEP